MIAVFLLLAAPIAIAGALAIAPLAGLTGLGGLIASLGGWRRRGGQSVVKIAPAGLNGAILAVAIVFYGLVVFAAWRVERPDPGRLLAEANLFWNSVLWPPLFFLGAAAFARPANDARERTERAFVAFAILLIVLLLFQRVSAFALTAPWRPAHDDPGVHDRTVGKGAVLLAIWVWPAASEMLRRGGALLGWFLLAAALAVFVYDYDATKFGFLVGLAAWGVAIMAPRLASVLTFGAAGAAVLGGPAALQWGLARLAPFEHHIPLSWRQRFDVWALLAPRAGHSLWGEGLLATRRLEAAGIVTVGAPLNHPHNGVLEIWTDLGVAGAAATALLLGLMGLWTLRAPRSAVPAIVASLASAFVIACSAYSLWESWWLASLILTGGMAVFAAHAAVSDAEEVRA